MEAGELTGGRALTINQKQKHVLFSGYYGYQNTGDEAVLAAVVETLYRYLPELKVTVLSGDPDYTRRVHGLNAVPSRSLPAVWEVMQSADLLISGGGSLLQDVTSLRSAIYYLGVILLGRRAGLPVVCYAQGVGPLNNKFLRRLAGHVLNRVERISVRDEPSLRLLEELGINLEIRRTADPVFALQGRPMDLGKGEGIKWIGIALRPWEFEARFCKVIEEFVLRLISLPGQFNVLFIPMHWPGDYRLAEEVVSRIKTRLISGQTRGDNEVDRVHLMEEQLSPAEMLEVFSRLTLTIGMRLHALIMSLSCGVPVLGLAYDPKVEGLLADFNEQPVGTPAAVTLDDIWERMGQIFAARNCLKEAYLKQSRLFKDQIEDEIKEIVSEFLM